MLIFSTDLLSIAAMFQHKNNSSDNETVNAVHQTKQTLDISEVSKFTIISIAQWISYFSSFSSNGIYPTNYFIHANRTSNISFINPKCYSLTAKLV